MKIGAFEVPPYAESLGTGLASWTNPSNQFTVLLVHYTADPKKRTSDWKKNASTGYREPDWDQEFEINFSSWSGRPVFSGFRAKYHVSEHSLLWLDQNTGQYVGKYSDQRYMWRGWDVGIHACVWAQVWGGIMALYMSRISAGAFTPVERDKYSANEVQASGLSVFIEECLELSETYFPKMQWKDVIDPSAFNRTVTQEQKVVDIFLRAGINPEPGVTNRPPVRISHVEDWLGVLVRGDPALCINKDDMLLVDLFAGGYKYDKDGQSPRPQKNAFSHPGNAVEYLCGVNVAPKSGGQIALQPEMIVRPPDPASHDLTGYNVFSKLQNKENSSMDWREY